MFVCIAIHSYAFGTLPLLVKELKGWLILEDKIQLHLEFLIVLLSGGVPYHSFGFICSLKSMK